MIVAGLYILFGFGFETVGKRLWIDVDGIITASTSAPFKGAPRYRTDYLIVSSDGRTQAYTAGGTDASLQRGLPVGVRLTKHRWDLGYTVDGRRIAFPMYFYVPVLAGGLVLLTLGGVQYRAASRATQSTTASIS